MPAQVPTTSAAPTHQLTSSSRLPNRVTLSPTPVYQHKQLAAPPVAPSYSAHTNKGFRYDLARVRCTNTPVYIVRRLCSRILYSYTCASVITKHLDITVTSPHRKCACSAGYAQATYLLLLAVDQYNRTDRPKRTCHHPACTPDPSYPNLHLPLLQHTVHLTVAYTK